MSLTTQKATDGAADRGRFSSRRKLEAVLRLLRGEDLDKVSRDLGVSGAVLASASGACFEIRLPVTSS